MRIINFFIFIIAFVIFFPKENLVYTIQKELAKKEIFINIDKIEGFMDLKNINVIYNNIDFLKIADLKIKLFLLKNSIEAKNIILNFQNIKLKKLTLNYSLFSFKKIFINGTSNIGKIKGEIDLKSRKLKIYIFNLSNNDIKFFLKRDKKGYFYETLF